MPRPYSYVLIVLLLASGLAWTGSQDSIRVGGIPLFAICASLAFLINWAVFMASYLAQTEHYFDLTGSLTYLTLMAIAFGFNPTFDVGKLLLASLVALWAFRLGTFLFRRVRRAGSDARFDALKTNFGRFLLAWTLQALWVLMTLSCVLAAITSLREVPLGAWAALGISLWLIGFTIETISDRQKSLFRAEKENRNRFITSGLWAWSRHPNYFGEILLWLGIALTSFHALSGWQFTTLLSPIFVFILLTRISGIPLLEERGLKKWGEDEDYRTYLSTTPRLFPRPPRANLPLSGGKLGNRSNTPGEVHS